MKHAYGVHLRAMAVEGLLLVTVCSVLMDTINSSMTATGILNFNQVEET